jgi:hypothetical protein
MISRNTTNYIVDAGIAIAFLGVITTGILIRYILPSGSGHTLVWGLGRHDWGGLHFWLASGAVALALLHLILHWQWIWVTSFRLFRGEGEHRSQAGGRIRALVGVAVLVLLTVAIAALLWTAQRNATSSIARQPVGSRVEAGSGHGAETIRGSMTMAEAAAAARVPVAELRIRLGVPADTPADRRLGQLCREHGMSMEVARERILATAR